MFNNKYDSKNPNIVCSNFDAANIIATKSLDHVRPDCKSGRAWCRLTMSAPIANRGERGISALTYTASVAISEGGFNNWNWGSFAKSVGIGALSGALTAGIGNAYGDVGTFGKELHRAFTHASVQATIAHYTGGDVGSSFLSGFLGSGIGSGTNGLDKVSQLSISAVSGAGISTAINGGNFWENLTISAIVVGLNHLADKGSKEGYGKIFSDETEAYNFIWNNAIKTGVEHSGFILKNGIFISDISGNTETSGGNDIMRYKVKNGILKVGGKSYSIKGHLHTHQALDKLGGTNRYYGFSDEDRNFAYKLQKPIFAMGRNNSVYGYDYLRYVGQTYSPFLNMSGFSTTGLLSGKNSLIKYLK